MKTLNIRSLVKEPISKIWKDHCKEDFCSVPPLSVESAPFNSIIFIGINPSLSDAERLRLSSGSNNEIEFYGLNQNGEGVHKYFNKFVEIAEELKMPWGHLDLLYIRETDQNKLYALLKTPAGLDFIYRQIMVTKNIIDNLIAQSDNIIFVVNNSFARTLLGKDQENEKNVWMGYDFIWNPSLGTPFIGKTPFFFSSMLTGQRALDIGSYERLKWHINFVKEGLK